MFRFHLQQFANFCRTRQCWSLSDCRFSRKIHRNPRMIITKVTIKCSRIFVDTSGSTADVLQFMFINNSSTHPLKFRGNDPQGNAILGLHIWPHSWLIAAPGNTPRDWVLFSIGLHHMALCFSDLLASRDCTVLKKIYQRIVHFILHWFVFQQYKYLENWRYKKEKVTQHGLFLL